MRFCRFQFNNLDRYGLVEASGGKEFITGLLAEPEQLADIKTASMQSIDPVLLAQATMRIPIRPSKIICVGRNYREHAEELGHDVPKEPLLFLKPPSSLIASGEKICRPKLSQRTDYEGELGVVVARRCHKIGASEDVRPYILGYTPVNDFTARDLQEKDGQWSRSKGFDTFCPVGPVVSDELDPWAGVGIQTRVNGEVRQDGNTRDFIFALDVVLRAITEAMTLFPGDLICTGTPKGVGPVVAGDLVEVTVAKCGTLSNPVVDE